MMGMPSCREVARAVASGELEEAAPLRRVAVRLHLLMCRHCRRYSRQIRALGLAAREALARPSGERESLERLRRALLGRLEPPGGG
jgi:predicted anti-sigma-YlaC factor YlaD